jgi:hypothetical protein
MTVVKTDFTIPCTQDKAVLIVQDVVDGLKWRVLEMGMDQIVFQHPPLNPNQWANFPKITISLKERGTETMMTVVVSARGPGGKKIFTGILGQVVNSISIRAQTSSIAINPTVSVGEGQNETTPDSNSRINQLERLQKLFEGGILSVEELAVEKKRITG